MLVTMKNENEYGGWTSPQADGHYKFPVTLEGFCNIRPWEKLIIKFWRRGFAYDEISLDFSLADEVRREISHSTSKLLPGPSAISAYLYFNAIGDSLPNIEEFYVLTPAEDPVS
jgi:hypothetical protein